MLNEHGNSEAAFLFQTVQTKAALCTWVEKGLLDCNSTWNSIFYFFSGRFKSLALARPIILPDAQTFVHLDDNKHRSQQRWVLPSVQEGAGWRPRGFNFPATDQRQAAECLACLQTNIPDRKRGYTNETCPAPLRRNKASCASFLIKLLLHSS